MTIRQDGNLVCLEGECLVEEAEMLVTLLQSASVEAVDLTGCGHMHAAVAQALLAFPKPLRGEPRDPFVRELLLPALARRSGVRTQDKQQSPR